LSVELEQALLTTLRTISGLTSFVADRIYPDHRPQTSYNQAAVEYSIDDLTTPSDLAGADGSGEAEVSLTFVALDLLDCESMATAVRNAINGTFGTRGDLQVDSVICAGDSDSIEYAEAGASLETYQITSTYSILYQLGDSNG